MKAFLLFCFASISFQAFSQEFFPYTESATPLPKNTLSARVLANYEQGTFGGGTVQRYIVEGTAGLTRNLTVNAGFTLSNMQQPSVRPEGAKLFAKYKLFGSDAMLSHFRLSLYGLGSYSKNRLERNELNLQMTEQKGVEGGLIATQVWNKFALSGSAGWTEVLDKNRNDEIYQQLFAFEAMKYSLSAGYMFLPFTARYIEQGNLSFYLEVLGGRNFGFPSETHYTDLAPSIQAIFNNTSKLNIGYRFQLSSDIDRISRHSFMVGYEYFFIDALKKRKSSYR